MTIEKLQKKDLDDAIALVATLVPRELSIEQAYQVYDQIKDDDNYALLAAKEGDELLGTVTAIVCGALTSPFLVLEDFVVKPGRTGQGIGGMLLDATDRFAVAHHCTYAILVSSGFRKDAHRFYENHGFTEDVRGFRKGY